MRRGFSVYRRSARSATGITRNFSSTITFLALIIDESASIANVAFNHFVRGVRNLAFALAFATFSRQRARSLTLGAVDLAVSVAYLTSQFMSPNEKLFLSYI